MTARPAMSILSRCIAGPSRLPRLSAFMPITTLSQSQRQRQLPVAPYSLEKRWNSSIGASKSSGAGSEVKLAQKSSDATIQDDAGRGSSAGNVDGKEGDGETLRLDAPAPGARSQKIAQVEPRLSLTFTCTADECNHRSTHEFSKRAYTKGIVLVQCPECKNRHLIADHIGWFKESTEDGKLRTVEDLLRAKGEKVRTGKVNFDGDVEYDPEV